MNKEEYQEMVNKLPSILSSFNIDYRETGNRYFFPCPIHGSDNYNSVSIYKESGNWICFTCGCQMYDILSTWPLENLIMKIKKIRGMSGDLDLSSLPVSVEVKRVKKPPPIVPRSSITPIVNSNVPFFIRRGFTEEILRKYDIFTCNKKRNLLYGRIVFPVYDDDYNNAIGFLGRTIAPQCPLCKKFHFGNNCPIEAYDIIKSEKWVNSRGFSRNNSLFNYWFAKEYINQTKSIVLVEGVPDVLKLEQAGIHNSVAIFGTALSKNQAKKIDKTGAVRLYLATDCDVAGENAALKIEESLRGRFDIKRIELPEKDFGDMSSEEIHKYLPIF